MERRMAKGTIWLMGAQVAFLLSGYIIHFGLGRTLGPAEYGTFGVIISILGIVGILLQSGVPQAVSKFIADNRQISSIKKSALAIQSIFFISCSFTLFILAPYISRLLRDESLTWYLRLISCYIPIFSVGQIFMYILNGKRLFKTQALIMIIRSVIRPIFVFMLVFIGFSIPGAIGGYIIAASFTLLASMYFIRNIISPSNTKPVKIIEVLLFSAPIVIYSMCLFSIRSIDLLFVKGLITEKNLVGFYTAAWAISILPVSVFAGVSQTLLPSISGSITKKDMELTRSYIKNSIRYSLMLLLPIALLIAANPGKILSIFYTPEYEAGGEALRILIIGMVFFTFFSLLNTVIIAHGKPKIPMTFVFSLLILDITLNYLLIPIYGLEGAAWATAMTSFIGLIMGLAYIRRNFGIINDMTSLGKIFISAFIICFIAFLLPFSGLILMIIYILLLILYMILLWILREIKNEDIDLIRNFYK